jgi:CheY-like chemotaxis protein
VPAARPTVPTLVAKEIEKVVIEGRTILFVDDDPMVLRAGARMLQALGCKVLTAPSGSEGIELCKAHRQALSVAIVDLIMPDKDGFATAQELRALLPQAPILLASGFTAETGKIEDTLREDSLIAFVQKPYNSTQLITVMRRLLAALPTEAATDRSPCDVPSAPDASTDETQRAQRRW